MSKPTPPPRSGARQSEGRTRGRIDRPRSASVTNSRGAERNPEGLAVGPVLTLPELPELETSYEDQARKMDFRYRAIIANVEQIVRAKLGGLPRTYRYHCLEHTEQVVRNALAIAAAERLLDEELPLLIIAAWLHDFMVDEMYVGHETAACEFATTLLSPPSAIEDALTVQELEVVQSSIMATKLPQRALHHLAEILADADLLYLGTNLFSAWSARLRDEHAAILGRAYTDLDWAEINIEFLRGHQYFTSFARTYCEQGVALNIRFELRVLS